MRFKKIILSLILVAAIGTHACGGSKTPGPIPEDYSELVTALNEQSVTLAAGAAAFARELIEMNAFNPNAAMGNAIVEPLQQFIATGENLLNAIDRYNALVEAYDEKIGATFAMTSSVTRSSVYKQSIAGGVTTNIRTVIEAGKASATQAQTRINGGDQNGAQQTVAAYQRIYLGSAFNTGIAGRSGSGNCISAGKTTATMSSPALVITGEAQGVAVLTTVWSWCATDGSGTCSIVAIQGTSLTLPDGTIGVPLTLPRGPAGNICMHITGTSPVCINASVPNEGITITPACFADDTDGSEPNANACTAGTTTAPSVTTMGSDCATHVNAVGAATVIDSAATVTIITSLPTAGCTINYVVDGSDGFTQFGNPMTTADGTATFTFPIGAPGVQTTVTLTCDMSGKSSIIGYSF